MENTDFYIRFEYQLANLVDIILDVEDHFKTILIMSLWKNGRCQINIRNNRFQIKSTVIGNDIVEVASQEGK
jgi:hypothetical protein